jgi:hypothetical protein
MLFKLFLPIEINLLGEEQLKGLLELDLLLDPLKKQGKDRAKNKCNLSLEPKLMLPLLLLFLDQRNYPRLRVHKDSAVTRQQSKYTQTIVTYLI